MWVVGRAGDELRVAGKALIIADIWEQVESLPECSDGLFQVVDRLRLLDRHPPSIRLRRSRGKLGRDQYAPLIRRRIGQYSFGIFLVNGIVRVPFVYFAHTADLQLTLSIANAAVSIAIASFFHYLLAPSTRPVLVTASPAPWAVGPASTGSD